MYLQMKTKREPDAISRVRAQWKAVRPDLDTSPMGIIGRIFRLELLAGEKLRRGLQPLELDLGSFDVLATLFRAGSKYRLTPTALYRELILSSGAMTNRLDGLERSGWVKRLADPSDRRGTLIELTAKGKALINQAIELHLENEATMVAALSQDERKRLAALLGKLLATLENKNENK
jgi:DNA-binding MarR family transcriptional regulator